MEVLRTPQFYVMYVAFVLMATGGLLVTANAGPMARSWGFSHHARRHAEPAGQRRGRIFWGWASDRLGRENTMIFTFVLQALCLVAVATLGQTLGRVVRGDAGRRLLHLGPDLFAVPGHVRRLLRHQARDLELRGALHGKGRRLDHRRLRGGPALRTVRQLGDGLLRQRRDGAGRGGAGLGLRASPATATGQSRQGSRVPRRSHADVHGHGERAPSELAHGTVRGGSATPMVFCARQSEPTATRGAMGAWLEIRRQLCKDTYIRPTSSRPRRSPRSRRWRRSTPNARP